MIKLTRIRTNSKIDKVFVGKKRIELNEKLLKAQQNILSGKAKKHEWDSGIWGKSKPQLLAESANKCAYCEAPLKVVAYGDVEHYRPKSIYWWLAYSYENYLASCTLCNQAYKKDNFPLLNKKNVLKEPSIKKTLTAVKLYEMAPKINPDPLKEEEGMAYEDFISAHEKENALLINPYYTDPEKIFEYEADDNLKEVEIRVKKGVKNGSAIEKAVVDNYGLNRLELRQLRYEWYDNYATLKLTLEELKISSQLRKRIEVKLNDLKKSASPFCGMIRFFEK